MRSAAERRRLVEYVRETAHLQETDWLEHKRGYDLTRNPGRAAVAKQLIGFANRRPESAARHADGFAYLLLGVEPGSCPGVPIHDSAEIETWLRPFVGPELHFDVQYVGVGDVQVLLLVVDPPEPGDPVHCLRRASEDPESGRSMDAGTVFVRKPGKTEPAMPEDIDALTDRARRRSQGLQLHLRASELVVTVPRSELTDAARELRLRDEREELLGRLPQTAVSAARRPPGEKRTQHEFIAEVEQYCAELRARWPVAVALREAEERPEMLQLELVNDTDTNFEDTVVELTLPLSRDRVHTTVRSAKERLRTLLPPEPWAVFLPLGFIEPVSWEDRHVIVEARGATETFVEFPPMRARPKTPHPLPEVVLLVLPDDPAPLPISWRATSASTNGELTGEVEVPVSVRD